MSNSDRRIGRARARLGDDPLADRLSGLKVAVDRGHLYRPQHPLDRGAVFTLANGAHVAEADLILCYTAALAAWLRRRGAEVLEPSPRYGILSGEYRARNVAAHAWGAYCYLSCHVNAGRGSYALTEHMAAPQMFSSLSAALGRWIVCKLVELRGLTYHAPMPLTAAQRGAVCIRAFPGPAVIVEPFFGDNPRHHALLRHDGLVAVGEQVGEGVARWWESVRVGE